jgi:proline iminopeptidase
MTLQRLRTSACAVVCALTACHASRVPRSEGTIDIGSGRHLAYVTVGSGKDTVVVLHGGPGVDHDYLESPLMPLVAGRTLIYYDQRGRGHSTAIADSLALAPDSDVADLETLRRHFALDRMTLVGHHWGAAVSALYAIQHPERVSRILMVSPFVVHPSFAFEIGMRNTDTTGLERDRALIAALRRGENVAEACRVLWPSFFYGSPRNPQLNAKAVGVAVCGAPADRVVQAEAINYQVVSKLGYWSWRVALNGLAVPVLVIEGEGDDMVQSAALRWGQHLPDARVLLIPGPAGFPWLGARAAFDAAALEFLGGRWPGGAIKPEPFVAQATPPATVINK